ncbi:MAG: ribonuclease III [Phycisphaera sp.]|nr:ribonuclease III [Phycisphaera sp.]
MIEQAQKVIGYTFRDGGLLTEALTHASSVGQRLESNERMEFLGDAILGFVVCEYLFAHNRELLEGEMTKIKSAVVSRRVCAQISKSLDLGPLLSVGKGMNNRPSLPGSILAAAFESIIAAIYLDGGMEPAREFILKQITPHIVQTTACSHQQNFKSLLQQHAQRHLPNHPQYVVLDEKGPDHHKAFEVCVELEGRRFTSSWANSKKEAEQRAALEALLAMGLVTRDEEGEVRIVEEHREATDSSSSAEEMAGN